MIFFFLLAAPHEVVNIDGLFVIKRIMNITDNVWKLFVSLSAGTAH